MKPFNLYYHMYSGEKPSALSAIRHFLDLARKERLIPVPASEYAAIADDFFATRIEQIDALAWAITDRGTLQTVRFDDAEQLGVDIAKSEGVIGATRHNGTLYVALDRVVDRAIVHLAERKVSDAQPMDTKMRPQLLDSRWRLSALSGDACRFSMTGEGYGEGDMRFTTTPGRRFDVAVRRGGETLSSLTAQADPTGELHMKLAADAREPVDIAFACHD